MESPQPLSYSPVMPLETRHAIRLRGPWRCQTSLEEPSQRCTVPGDWGELLGDDFRGEVIYSRNFGRPTGLEPEDSVELVIEQVDPQASVLLNGRLLGEIPPGGQAWRRSISDQLEARNELQVRLSMLAEQAPARPPGREGTPGGILGEVRLEIIPAG